MQKISYFKRILTINGGSSSIKFALYQVGEELKRGLHGKVDRIGLSGTNLTFHDPASHQQDSRGLAAADHKSAANFLIDWLEEQNHFASVRAAEAVALFCYQAKKWIGSFAAALGGLDTLVFAGGIGENAPPVRARICDGLGCLGIELEEKRNAANESVISAAASRVAVRVIRTNEELMIARSVLRFCAATIAG